MLEAHAFAGFLGIDGENVAHGNLNVVGNSTEACRESDPVIVDADIAHRAWTDIEDDLSVPDVGLGNLGAMIDPDGDIGREVAVHAPFIEGAQEIRLLGRPAHHALTCAWLFLPASGPR